MPTALPYVPSNRNLETLFNKIASAKIPPKFTHEFLRKTIGLTGTNDRAFIPLLRTLGFLDQSGTPTAKYATLKNPSAAKTCLGAAIRAAYAPLFDSDENAHKLTNDKLKGLVAQVAGTDEAMTARIQGTFNALTKLADLSGAPVDDESKEQEEEEEEEADDKSEDTNPKRNSGKGLRPEFHYNFQIHLPANGTEEVYRNIFNALRKVFG